MASVESGYGENVHDGEYDAEKCGHAPEDLPVPHWGEEVGDGDE